MSKSFFNEPRDLDLVISSQNFLDLILQEPAAYGLSVAQVQAYQQAHQAYAEAVGRAVDPGHRTVGAVMHKNQMRRELLLTASATAKIIQGTGTVSDEQKITLGLAVKRKPSPRARLTEEPSVRVTWREGTLIEVRLLAVGTNKLRGRPDNADGSALYSFVGEKPPGDLSEWDHRGMQGNSKWLIDFPGLPAGTKVWLSARWYNARGQGPGSSPISTVLAGGAMSAGMMRSGLMAA